MIETRRLYLRAWKDEDIAPFAAMNACPKVMQHMPGYLSESESRAWVGRIQDHFATHGYGLFAVERKDSGAFIGYVGIQQVSFDAPFTPAVEIGWRIATDHWGHGFAPEAAWHVLDHAFTHTYINEIVSLTILANTQSRRVMDKIGMQRDENGDFEHPRLPEGHHLRPHILYRMTKDDWESINAMPDWVMLNEIGGE